MSSKTWFKHLFPNCPEKRIGDEVRAKDVLGFVDTQPYPDRLKKAAQKTGESESLWCSEAKMGHLDVVAALFEFGFMGGSLGTAAGTRFCLGVDRAIEKQCPFICVTASGGARMQEGVAALFQMAKTVQALNKLADHRLPYISILTDPTTGGVAASLAMRGDIIIAEKEALIGFTGPRVIEQTLKVKLPEGFQRAESCLELGAVDRVATRQEIPGLVHELLSLLVGSNKDNAKARNTQSVNHQQPATVW